MKVTSARLYQAIPLIGKLETHLTSKNMKLEFKHGILRVEKGDKVLCVPTANIMYFEPADPKEKDE